MLPLRGHARAAAKDQPAAARDSPCANFDDQGRAVIPLWTHRLVLTRADKTLTPILTANGDGTGLEGPEG